MYSNLEKFSADWFNTTVDKMNSKQKTFLWPIKKWKIPLFCYKEVQANSNKTTRNSIIFFHQSISHHQIKIHSEGDSTIDVKQQRGIKQSGHEIISQHRREYWMMCLKDAMQDKFACRVEEGFKRKENKLCVMRFDFSSKDKQPKFQSHLDSEFSSKVGSIDIPLFSREYQTCSSTQTSVGLIHQSLQRESKWCHTSHEDNFKAKLRSQHLPWEWSSKNRLYV